VAGLQLFEFLEVLTRMRLHSLELLYPTPQVLRANLIPIRHFFIKLAGYRPTFERFCANMLSCAPAPVCFSLMVTQSIH